MLFRLIHLSYEPGTLLRDHVAQFKNLYVDLVETIDGHPTELRFLEVSQGMAAILFLKSLRHDSSLSSLVQSSYDLTPFTLDAVSNRIMLEDSRRESHDSETSYLALPSDSSSRGRFKSRRNPQSTRSSVLRPNSVIPKSVAPTRKFPQKKDPDIQARVNQLAEELKRLQTQLSLNLIEESFGETDEEIADVLSEGEADPNVCGFYTHDEGIYSTTSGTRCRQELVYDSGASRSIVCDKLLLLEPTPLAKSLNTYRGKILITHVGKLDIGGTLIYPVYFAPQGPRNLVSATQLEDHGLKILHQHRTILIKLSAKIIFWFLRVGNLYVAHLNSSRPLVSYSLTVPHPNVDWHLILGHPLDEYLRKFLSLHSITNHNPLFSLANCEVCKSCKMKRSPHSNPLPSSSTPFHRLHMDVLQISPPSKHGMH